MNTEIPDNKNTDPAGRIFFDAECRFCVAHRRRWGPLFERRGFVWLPLQTPGTAERLGITEAQLREEMWLQLADGRKFSGVNVWSVLMRRVWWLWPPGILLALPGFNAVARAVYRRIARNRYCLGGRCSLPPAGTRKPGRHAAFFELP
jgi:predicted DCC family thiol-disulfide oxidoreductase YuxK